MPEYLNSLANEVADDLVKSEKIPKTKAFDPATILVIAQIIVFIISLFKKKDPTPAGVKEQASKTNFIQRALIKRKLKRYMWENTDHYSTYDDYKDSALKVSLRRLGETEIVKVERVMSELPTISNDYLS